MPNRQNALQTDSLTKGIGFLAIANLAQRAIGFARNLAFCYFLNKSEVGMWALASSFFVLAAPLSVLGLPGCFGRYVETFRRQGQLYSFVRRGLTISCIGVSMVSLILLCFSNATSELIFGHGIALREMLLIIATLIAVVAFNTIMELLTGLRQPTAVSQMQLVSSVGFSLMSLPLVMYQPHWTTVVACFGLSMAIGLAPGIYRLRKRCQPAFQAKEVVHRRTFLMRVAPFALTVWLTDLLTNLFDVVDRYMLLHMATSDSVFNQGLVGQFHTARILPVLFLSLASMMAGMLLPYWSSDWEAGQRGKVEKDFNMAIKTAALASWLISIVAVFFSPLLFEVFFQDRYIVSQACFPIALAHCVFASIVMLQCSAMRCVEANRYSVLVLALAFVVNMVANYFAVPVYGVVGAMLATLVATIGMMVVNAVVLASFDIKLDRQTALLMCLPIALIFPLIVNACLLAGLLVIAGRTDWILDDQDRQSLDAALLPRLNRFGIGLRTLWPA